MRGYRYASAGTTVLTLALALYGCGKDATAPPEHRVAAPVDMASLTGGADLPGLAAAAGPRSSDPCTYSEATGRFTCPPVTRNGLTITRSFAYLDAGGQPQARYDAETTASVNMQTAVQGSTTRGAASVTVERSADVTVSGLAGSETTRTVNGTESGTVVTSGTGERGAFRSTTASADTTSNVVLPVRGSASRWPLSGSVVHNATTTVTAEAGSRTFRTRTVTTYNGTAVITVVITSDRGRRTCTVNLETRTRSCS